MANDGQKVQGKAEGQQNDQSVPPPGFAEACEFMKLTEFELVCLRRNLGRERLTAIIGSLFSGLMALALLGMCVISIIPFFLSGVLFGSQGVFRVLLFTVSIFLASAIIVGLPLDVVKAVISDRKRRVTLRVLDVTLETKRAIAAWRRAAKNV